MAFRARIALLAAAGMGTNAIAEQLGTRPATVTKWRRSFAKDRFSGLDDIPRSGKRPIFGPSDEQRILDKLSDPLPEGCRKVRCC